MKKNQKSNTLFQEKYYFCIILHERVVCQDLTLSVQPQI